MAAKLRDRRYGHKRKNTHSAPQRLIDRRRAAGAWCTHCQGTGKCPGCGGDTTQVCGECSTRRAGYCTACDGQGDHS